MKMLAVACVLVLTAWGAQADGLSGIFQTQANDQGHVGMVEFYDCSGKTCGKLVKSFDSSGQEIGSPHTGKNIVAGMTDDGGGKFSGGTIWDPGSDKTYKTSMQLGGNSLKVTGCIVRPLCKTQKWTRAK